DLSRGQQRLEQRARGRRGPGDLARTEAQRALERGSGSHECGFLVTDVEELLGCAQLVAQALLAEKARVDARSVEEEPLHARQISELLRSRMSSGAAFSVVTDAWLRRGPSPLPSRPCEHVSRPPSPPRSTARTPCDG